MANPLFESQEAAWLLTNVSAKPDLAIQRNAATCKVVAGYMALSADATTLNKTIDIVIGRRQQNVLCGAHLNQLPVL